MCMSSYYEMAGIQAAEHGTGLSLCCSSFSSRLFQTTHTLTVTEDTVVVLWTVVNVTEKLSYSKYVF